MIKFQWVLRLLLLTSFASVAGAQCSGSASSVGISLTSVPQYQTVSIPVTCSGAGTVTGLTVTFNNLSLSGDSLNLNNLGFVLASPSNSKFIDFLDSVDSVALNSSYYLTFSDSASSFVQAVSGSPVSPAGTSGSPAHYKPTDYGLGDAFPSPIGTIASSDGAGCGTDCGGTATFTNTFSGITTAEATASSWTVYIGNFSGSVSGSIDSIVLNLTTSGGASTTTSLAAGSPNPSFTSGADSAVTLTATVTSTGTVSGGTVSFFDGGNAITCSGGTQVVSNGSATCVKTFTTQGPHNITASYGGNGGSFAASGVSNTVVQNVNGHTTQTGNTLCNTGSIAIPNGIPTTGVASTPYPSNLILGGSEPTLSGIIQKLTLTLNGFNYPLAEDVGMLLVAPASNGSACTSNCTAYEFLSNAGGDLLTSPIDLTFDDDAANPIPSELTNGSGGTYKPTSVVTGNPPGDGYPSPAPQSFAQAAPNGSATFLGEFGGLGLNGTWTLYVSTRGENGPGAISGGWCLNLTMQSGADGTGTTVSGSPNPATTGASATIAATVTDTSHPSTVVNAGSVTFTDGTTTLGTVSVSSGSASLGVSSLAEGTHHILASYSGGTGTTTFGVSSGSYNQRIDNATTASGTGPYSYCNAGAIAVPAAVELSGAASPYPSNITVSNLPGTVEALTVTLDGFTAHSTVDNIGSLLVAPNGANLDFFSNAGGVGDLTSPVDLTFQDGATVFPAALTGGGTFSPVSDSPKDSYPACPANATNCTSPAVGPPMTVTSFNYASSNGSSVFGDDSIAGVFGGTGSSTFNGNGQWNLFMVAPNEGQGNINIANGWCLNFTENPVTVAVGRVYSSFEQGQSGSVQVNVANNSGPGSTGDPSTTNPLTVVDTLPSGFSPGTGSGTGWSCTNSGQQVTCTNDSAIAESSAYPTLTIPVTVSGTEGVSQSNKVTTSGAGTTPTSNTDSLSIEEKTNTGASNQTATFSTSDQSVTLSASVSTSPGTVSAGTVTFSVFNLGTQIGSSTSAANVLSGNASGSYTLPGNTAAGTYTIDASYSGATGFAASSDNTHTLTVNPASTSTAATSISTNFSSSSQTVTLSAAVNSSAGTVNGGTVTFTLLNQSSQVVGSAMTSAPVSGGSASVNYTLPASTPVGTYTIQAVYSGNTNFIGSSDSSHRLTVKSVAPALTVTSFNVVFGSAPEVYNVTTSTRTRLPWEITAIQVVFSEPVASANINSLGGLTATGFSGLGTSTLTWTITPTPIGSFSATLATTGPNALMDASSNALNNGAGFTQPFKVLWGDFNDDGIVNASDIALVSAARSQTYNILADMNGDGVVNAADVTIVGQRAGTKQQ